MFGPEYVGSTQIDLGVIEIGQSKPVDIYIKSPIWPTQLLPPGGYIIKYINGAFLLLGDGPAVFVVGGKRGMQVQWQSSTANQWTSVHYPIDTEVVNVDSLKSIDMTNLKNYFYIEFTTPHKMQIVPPKSSVGSVRLRVWRYVPTMFSGQ